jgi:bifunctional DNase/RNase
VLQAAIESLPPSLGRVVALHYLDGLSYDEVAAALEVPVSTVKGRLFKSRRRLRHTLAAAGVRTEGDGTGPLAPNQPRKKGARLTMSEAERTAGDGAAGQGEVEVEVELISIRTNTQYPHRVVVLKPRDAERYLYVVVGVPEADAIALKLNKADVPRPMTHDLMLSGFGALGAEVRRVVVNDRRGETFYAQVFLAADGQEVVLDSRPSDALALAVRAEVPIFVAESVLARCGTDQRPGTPLNAAEP